MDLSTYLLVHLISELSLIYYVFSYILHNTLQAQEECPICSSRDFVDLENRESQLTLSYKGFTVSQTSFRDIRKVKCKSCGFTYIYATDYVIKAKLHSSRLLCIVYAGINIILLLIDVGLFMYYSYSYQGTLSEYLQAIQNTIVVN